MTVAANIKLSPQQRRVWSLQAEGTSPVYRVATMYVIEGGVEKRILRQALREVIHRHEPFRAGFSESANGLTVQLRDFSDIAFTEFDLQAYSTTHQASEVDRLFEEQIATGFNFKTEALLRVSLIILSPRKSLAIFSAPALCCDRMGMRNLVKEMADCYVASANDCEFDAPVINFSDLAEWQNQMMADEEAEFGRGYWRAKMSEFRNLRLPFQRNAALPIPVRPARLSWTPPALLVEEIRRKIRSECSAVEVFVQALFMYLVAHIAREPEVFVGIHFDGRRRFEEIRNVVGPMARCLPVGSTFSPALTVRSLVENVEARTKEAGCYQDYFDYNYEQGSQAEFCSIQFEGSQPAPSISAGGLTFSPLQELSWTEIFDLKLHCMEEDEKVTLEICFDPLQFQKQDVQRMGDQLLHLLRIAIKDLDAPLAELNLLRPEEELEFSSFNQTAQHFPAVSLVDLYAAGLRKRPDGIAVMSGEEQLSYEELERRANQLGRYLRRRGVGPEVRAALCIARSLEMVVGMLGVLKAGGAFVPLDPSYPAERLRYMVNNAEAAVVVVSGKQQWARLMEGEEGERPGEQQVTIVDLEEEWEEIGGESGEEWESGVEGENLAYIIYTSGSTGKPKGVMMPHRGIVNRVLWMQQSYGIGAEERVLQKTGLSFDASIWELFLPWVEGATVVLLGAGEEKDPRRMKEEIREKQVTVLQLVPSMLQVLVEEEGVEECVSLKRVFCGGEALGWEVCRRAKEKWGAAELVNLYGPTETAIDASSWKWEEGAEEKEEEGGVPIGRPIANARLYVLDEGMRPVVRGAVGELYIGGAGLGRGYAGASSLTAERFVPNPFVAATAEEKGAGAAGGVGGGVVVGGGGGGERLYRSGDLVRWNGRGELEYVGRIDQQVKVRGYRIELGEIETALNEHEGVKQAVVVVRPIGAAGAGAGAGASAAKAGTRKAEQQLVAYVVRKKRGEGEQRAAGKEEEQRPGEKQKGKVGRAGAGVSEAELQQYLRSRVPEYMVPAVVVFLEQMPLQPNGKLDRRGLPEAERRGGSGEQYREPKKEIEKRVAGIWAEVLQVERVGLGENFFAVGGHSLLAIQVMARVRKEFGVEVGLQVMFTEATVEGVSAAVAAELKNRGVEEGQQGSSNGSGQGAVSRWRKQRREAGAGATGATEGTQGRGTTRDALMPLSYAQQRVWVLEQLAKETGAYNMVMGLKVKGDLDGVALEASVDEMARRHELLRTRFVRVDGVVMQEVMKRRGWKLEWVELRGGAANGVSAEAEGLRRMKQAGREPLALEAGEVMRLKLYRIEEQEYLILVVLHHIISDGWSTELLLEELGKLYQAKGEEREAGLEEVGLQYGEYAEWEREHLQGVSLEQELEYWAEQLRGLEPLELPGDRRGRRGKEEQITEEEAEDKKQDEAEVQPQQRGGAVSRRVGAELSQAVKRMGEQGGVTLFMVLLAALKIVLYRWSGEEDVAVGTVVANRNEVETEKLIGCLMNFVVLRTRMKAEERIGELLERVKKTVVEAYQHQGCPFEKVVERVNPEREKQKNPLYNVGFLLQNYPRKPWWGEGLEISWVEMEREKPLLDLRLVAQEGGEGIELWCEYDGEQFERGTVEELLYSYEQVLGQWVAEEKEEKEGKEEKRVGEFAVSEGLQEQGRKGERAVQMVVSASFTAEPLESTVKFWLKQLGMEGRVRFAPYNQVFQQLLDEGSEQRRNRKNGLNVVLVRMEDWERYGEGGEERAGEQGGRGEEGEKRGGRRLGERKERLEENVRGLAGAVKEAAESSEAPYLVMLCPGSPALKQKREMESWMRRQQEWLAAELERVRGVYVVSPEELERLYPVAAYYDEYGDKTGHMPYKPAMYAALGTMVARRLHGLRRAPYKVIVLDCDETLWGGVCGEDAAAALVIDEQRRRLQEFMVRQQEEGMLLCLCSKNREEDVWEVFEKRGEMVLRREHLAGWRINWENKGENVRSLARELGLSLDSFIVLDDNPVECAAIQALCPEALVLQLPRNANYADLLEHLWIFDSQKSAFPDLSPIRLDSQLLLRITAELSDAEQIAQREARSGTQSAQGNATGGWPDNAIEKLLAEQWIYLLRRDKVGVNDDFFSLGGQSLLAARVLSRIQETFHIELPLDSIFKAPTIRSLAQVIQKELHQGSLDSISPIRRIPRDGDLLPSFAQERLWFIDQFEEGNIAYSTPMGLRMHGQLNVEALRRTFNEIVRRHEALRTHFEMRKGRTVQVIDADWDLNLPVEDLTAFSVDEQQVLARRHMRDEVARPFDLKTGPMLRVKLLRLSEQEHVTILNLHHIVFDAWSIGVLIKELATIYPAFCLGQASPLPELEIQYADYAARQRDRLQGEVLELQLQYWRETLSDIVTLEVPTDHKRSPFQTYEGTVYRFQLNGQLAQDLRALARQNNVTLFMTLLVGFKLLLDHYTGQHDIAVGSPVANRNRTELEPLIGLFVNTLVLRTHVEPENTVSDLLNRVKETTLGAQAHQDVPFEKIVDDLKPERELSRTPLFQVVFTLQNKPTELLQMEGLTFEPVEVETLTAKFDLVLGLMETDDDGLHGTMEYRHALYERATIERMIRHWQNLLAAMAAGTHQRISDLALMEPAEIQQLLGEEEQEYKVERTLPELFQEQARMRPKARAIISGEEQISYGELEHRANQLGRYLRARGVGPEVLAGICLERSAEMIIALLAVSKAGGTYVPLDPAYPPERLGYMVEDAGLQLLLTDSGSLESLPEAARGRAICLDREREAISVCSDEAFESGAVAANLAYVIYTSGSSGKPKGSLITHSNVVCLFQATQPCYEFDERDVWTFFHSFAFDFSVWEMWGALIYGGALVIVPYFTSRSPRDFYDLVVANRVTVLNQTPSAFRQFMEADAEQGSDLQLRCVIFGGEALDLSALRPWVERHGDRRPLLVNMYGITETTVHVTCQPLSEAIIHEQNGSLIGCAIPDLRVYVLDECSQLVPAGVAGEMFVGGEGLARGYLNRPELTAQRFIPNPYSARGGERLYRTGDLARWTSQGGLEYLGRIDQQVKIRGYRIELGEIEAVLQGYEGVKQALVVARQEQGEKRLVAYVVKTESGSKTGVMQLREHLKEKLPEYMVPSAWVFLETMPLTRNGKINFKALPAPQYGIAAAESVFEAPRNEIEAMLVTVWAEALQIIQPGIHDNFFALGGDSIRSIQVLALARERHLSFTLQQLFRFPTIAELAPQTRFGRDAVAYVLTQPFSLISDEDRQHLPRDVEDAYPLAALQAGMLYHMQLAPESAVYHNVDSVHLRAPVDVEMFRLAAQKVVERHPHLRTSFDLVRYSEPLQLVHRHAEIEVGFANIRHLTFDEQEHVIDEFMLHEQLPERRFDLAHPPLLRFFIHQRAEDQFQLTLTEHHGIQDGWSLHVTAREIFTHYFRLLSGRPAPVEPPLAITYRDFVHMERLTISNDECRHYWGEKLSGCSPNQLPRSERKHGAAPETRSRHSVMEFPMEIPSEVSNQLKHLAKSLAVPVKSVLLAAHLRVMAFISTTTDVLTGLTSHGRIEEAGGEDVRGLFLNVLPFRQKLECDSWKSLIKQTFQNEWEMLPYRRYPLPEIQNSLGNQPLFDTAFTFTHWHVIDNLKEEGQMELMHSKRANPTHFGFSTVFQIAMNTPDILLSVYGDLAKLDAEQIASIGGYFRNVLLAMANEPDADFTAFSLLGEVERRQIVETWNSTFVPDLSTGFVHHLFEAQTAKTPNAPALVFEDRQLTYSELNRQANQLANYLRKLGVGSEARVGIYAERSIEMVIALLATLKAGGAYMPLDPSYPAERLRYMLRNGSPLVLIANRHLQSIDEVEPKGLVIDLNQNPAAWQDQPETNLQAGSIELNSRNIAYVIYTSGSTGQPKGVMVEHGGLCNRLLWMQQCCALGSDDAVLQKTPFSFDVSVWEFFWPLLTGARLVMARPEGHKDPAYLAETICRKQITTVHFVPSMLQAFLEHADEKVDAVLRRVVCSGEVLSAALARQFHKRLPHVALQNLYGPTEATVEVTAWTCTPEAAAGNSIPIGRPIANIEMYVLDPWGEPVPAGVAGELFIGGIGVARGYLEQPGLTAERFVPNPFSAEAGARIYRTGDLGWWRRDGNIEFIGRNDSQVKIRGFRIELGEIEAWLQQHPGVEEAAILAREDAAGEKRLVAYVVTKDGEDDAGVPQLREYLKAKLPEYMVPAAWVFLDAMPLTRSGKLDRRALPASAFDTQDMGSSYFAPRNFFEIHMGRVWEEVIGRSPIGVHDDFFALGGHSIIALRLIAQIQKKLGYQLPLGALWEHPTIEKLTAFALNNSGQTVSHSHLLQLNAGVTENPPLFMVHGSGGGGYAFGTIARHLHPQQPFYVFQAIDVENPDISVESLALKYIREMKQVQAQGPYLLSGYSFGGLVAFEMAQQLRASGDEVALTALLDTSPPSISGTPGSESDFDPLEFVKMVEGIYRLIAPIPLEEGYLRKLGIKEQISYLVAQAKSAELIPVDVHPEYACLMLENLRSRIVASLKYQAVPFPGVLTLFRFSGSGSSPATESQDYGEGWQRLSMQPLVMLKMDTSHSGALEEPAVGLLAAQFMDCIESAIRPLSTRAAV